MLVLSRKPGEEIVIPSLDITLRLIEIRGDKARIGIAAPAHIEVHRQEVWEREQRCEVEAAVASVVEA